MPRLRYPIVATLAMSAAQLLAATPAGAARTTAANPAGATMAHAFAALKSGNLAMTRPAATRAQDYFNGDSCTSTSFCMAIGAYRFGTRGLSETFNGSSWITESVPKPTIKDHVIFANEVSCASPSDCVFVGQHYNSPTAPAQLAEFWNGTRWRIIASSNPGHTSASGLQDVSCPSTTFCMAVGAANVGRRFHATAYTWTNQTTLTKVNVPAPSHARTSSLAGLSCYSATDCMAVGDYTNLAGLIVPYAAKWHIGTGWKLLRLPGVRGRRSTFPEGVSCPSVSQCVAVGVAGRSGGSPRAFAALWNGASWRVVTSIPAPSFFVGASCPATNECFAAGSNVESWNGSSWSSQPTVRTSGASSIDEFLHISCVTPTTCEAVGARLNNQGGARTLAEVWDGTSSTWAVQTTTNP